jgi:hypothetical protein
MTEAWSTVDQNPVAILVITHTDSRRYIPLAKTGVYGRGDRTIFIKGFDFFLFSSYYR